MLNVYSVYDCCGACIGQLVSHGGAEIIGDAELRDWAKGRKRGSSSAECAGCARKAEFALEARCKGPIAIVD